MSIYATLHTHPTCRPTPKPICITRGASAQLTYPLSDKTFNAEDIEQVILCDAILMCPGWENSKGCKVEKFTAETYGKEVLYMK